MKTSTASHRFVLLPLTFFGHAQIATPDEQEERAEPPQIKLPELKEFDALSEELKQGMRRMSPFKLISESMGRWLTLCWCNLSWDRHRSKLFLTVFTPNKTIKDPLPLIV